MAALSFGHRPAAIEFLHHLALGESSLTDHSLDRSAE
jgi:hypothetical protein